MSTLSRLNLAISIAALVCASASAVAENTKPFDAAAAFGARPSVAAMSMKSVPGRKERGVYRAT